MKEKKIIEKKVEMKVADYVAKYNGSTLSVAEEIDRFDVYKMIKEGKLTAHKGAKGAWIIELTVQEEVEVEVPSTKKSKKKAKEYTVKEFVEAYNKKHSKNPITIPEVRKLLTTGKLDGDKVSGKWAVTASPSKRVK